MDENERAACLELDQVYRELGEALEVYRRPCLSSGQCCHFGTFDHMLFVTRLEALEMVRSGEKIDAQLAADGVCPFLRGRVCGIREHRAIGCRIFFCDTTFEENRNELYERFLKEVRAIEVRFKIPHEYVRVTEAFKPWIEGEASVAQT